MADTTVASGAAESVRSWGTPMRGKKKTKGMRAGHGYGKEGGEQDHGRSAGPHSMSAGGEKSGKFPKKYKKK